VNWTDTSQRISTSDPWIHEKIVYITSHQGSANEKHIKIRFHPIQNVYHQEYKKTTNAGEGCGGKEVLYTVGANVDLTSH
jgi:hypothetical protein